MYFWVRIKLVLGLFLIPLMFIWIAYSMATHHQVVRSFLYTRTIASQRWSMPWCPSNFTCRRLCHHRSYRNCWGYQTMSFSCGGNGLSLYCDSHWRNQPYIILGQRSRHEDHVITIGQSNWSKYLYSVLVLIIYYKLDRC